MFVKAGYSVPKNEQLALTSFSKGKYVAAVGTPRITQIDAEGRAIEEWTLNNPFIKSVKFGDLSYDSDELREISIEFRYDWASHAGDGVHFNPVRNKAEALAEIYED